jgi:hypothetical protein
MSCGFYKLKREARRLSNLGNEGSGTKASTTILASSRLDDHSSSFESIEIAVLGDDPSSTDSAEMPYVSDIPSQTPDIDKDALILELQADNEALRKEVVKLKERLKTVTGVIRGWHSTTQEVLAKFPRPIHEDVVSHIPVPGSLRLPKRLRCE